MLTVQEIMRELETCSTLIAEAIIRKVMPCQDDISENQARKAYGDKWLRHYKELGLADGHPVGGRVLYSRHHLDCLRAAEREHAKLIFKSIKK